MIKEDYLFIRIFVRHYSDELVECTFYSESDGEEILKTFYSRN